MSPTIPWSDACDKIAAQLAGNAPILVASDYDGTLAPIVDDPEQAGFPAETKAVLRVIRSLPGIALAFISGRALEDLCGHVCIEGAIYAGNHGLEMEGPGLAPFIEPQCTEARPSLDAALGTLATQLEEFPGLMLEDKVLSATVHYRRVDPALVPPLSLIVHSVAHALPRVVVRRGKQVLELRPAVKWHKGYALRHIAKTLGILESRTVYLGDDVTDEDVFALSKEAITVQVGSAPATHARYRADTLADAREFLGWLAATLSKERLGLDGNGSANGDGSLFAEASEKRAAE
jgi:trehalose 6-phosphate phosphatase